MKIMSLTGNEAAIGCIVLPNGLLEASPAKSGQPDTTKALKKRKKDDHGYWVIVRSK